jgi:hypothetical protein
MSCINKRIISMGVSYIGMMVIVVMRGNDEVDWRVVLHDYWIERIGEEIWD